MQDYLRRVAEARELHYRQAWPPKAQRDAWGSWLDAGLVSTYACGQRAAGYTVTVWQQLASLQLCKKNGVRPDQRTGGYPNVYNSNMPLGR